MALEDQGATPDVELQNEDAPKSMDDTIRETLRSLQSPDESTAAAPENGVAAGAVEEPEAAAARIRDASGKFAPKPAVEADSAAQNAATEPADPAAQADAISPPPNTWKKEVAAKWAALPPEVRAEVERREQDMHRGIEQYKAQAAFAQTIERAMAPYQQTLQQLGVSPDRAIGELMAADHKLRHGSPEEKTAYFAQLAHNYGIDLAGAAQHMANVDPNVFALQNRAQQLQAQLQQYQQTAQQQAEAQLNSEIAAFAADPSHSHFEAVRGHMSALLQAGQAKDLADAYEQAVYANPTTRAAVLQQQAAAQREEAAKKAQAARAAASVNVPRRPAMPTAQPIGSMDDTIRETFRRLTGAA
jgi:hypothetical protein